jgi:hypothetical protein
LHAAFAVGRKSCDRDHSREARGIAADIRRTRHRGVVSRHHGRLRRLKLHHHCGILRAGGETSTALQHSADSRALNSGILNEAAK